MAVPDLAHATQFQLLLDAFWSALADQVDLQCFDVLSPLSFSMMEDHGEHQRYAVMELKPPLMP